jgi:hexosaminidase
MSPSLHGIVILTTFMTICLNPVFAYATGGRSETVNIIPLPVSIKQSRGFFIIKESTRLVTDKNAAVEASKLINALAPAMGFRLQRAAQPGRNSGIIELALDQQLSELGNEGYTIEVNTERILICARREAGLFYGTITLLQLLPPSIFSKTKVENEDWKVPSVKITDYPRFQWRGLLVDPARHFIPKSVLLEFIDAMAIHKLNSLQIHFTDDQGWRLEIKKYPELIRTGAWRDETLIGHLSRKPLRFDGKRHGGFYTRQDIREIVEYASARHIRIVPEVEMPGHARAAISSYPQLGVFPEKQKDLKPWTRWGVSEHIFAPRPDTIAFLQDVLLEVMELFPSNYIHIGGDEAVKTQWTASEEIQVLIHEKGLKDEAELQSWFIRQMDTFLTRHGRRLIGWDDILQGGLAPGATVMSWRGEKGGTDFAHLLRLLPGSSRKRTFGNWRVFAVAESLSV